MSTPDEMTPEDRVRRIEEETEHLERTIGLTRDRVHEARQADSMALAGVDRDVPDTEPHSQSAEQQSSGEGETPEDAGDPS